jgi:glycerophosphoryl diester phosphodiesterase
MWRKSSIPFLKSHRPLVLAHRGDSVNVPENTLQAFIDADQLHVDVIETDVRMTKDGKFVFNHDAKVNRTTNGKGTVREYDLVDIKRLDAGYRYKTNDNQYVHRGKGLQILTIEEILDKFPTNRFNMDIKDTDPQAPILLAEKIKKFNAESRIQVSSFHQQQIIKFRSYSNCPTSASIVETWQFRKKAFNWIKHNELMLGLSKSEDTIEQQKVFGQELPYCSLTIPEKIGPIRFITPDFIKFAHLMSIAVLVWTINDEKEMKKFLDWNIDGIFTDSPEILIKLMNNCQREWRD